MTWRPTFYTIYKNKNKRMVARKILMIHADKTTIYKGNAYNMVQILHNSLDMMVV